jgi:hypothetical protein
VTAGIASPGRVLLSVYYSLRVALSGKSCKKGRTVIRA